jgi:hypothetical protein
MFQSVIFTAIDIAQSASTGLALITDYPANISPLIALIVMRPIQTRLNNETF